MSFKVLYNLLAFESIKMPEVEATAKDHGYESVEGYMLYIKNQNKQKNKKTFVITD